MINILSFSNYILYYPEIFIELNDIAVSLNQTIAQAIKQKYSTIVNNTILGNLTKYRAAYNTGKIFGNLNSIYAEAFNFTKPKYHNTSNGARAFFKGIESDLSLYYYNHFAVSESVLSEEFDLSIIRKSILDIVSLNLTQHQDTVIRELMVSYDKIFFDQYKLL